MMSNSERMIKALEERNQILRDDIQKIREDYHKLKFNERASTFYMRMQKHIREDENIRYAWEEFMTIYTLAIPDVDDLKDIKTN